MFKNLTIGQHYPVDSPIHNLDPRLKIIMTFIFIISLFLIESFTGFLFVVAFLTVTITISKVPVKFVIKGLRPILFIILITFIINLLMTPGRVIFTLGFIKITEEGLRQAGFMAIRLTLLIMGTSLLTLTTSPIILTDGIESLLKPFKRFGLPAHELAMMMTIALRFIPTLMEETEKIMKAQKSRGADFESGNIISRAKNLVPLLVPLFISAFRRADELAMAMEARCYRGGENRTRMRQMKILKGDYVAAFVFAVYFAAIIVFKIW
ncbi:MAG: energy-coupling factor transporter transmembrane component T [Tissierellia bacterium]|jgi:energy-coupling factor transport system permease protein|nr:energy-coupling factor transporter transmembrane component T [Tissierellia bacterium]MDD3227226.1 energy-coupling factor transporter transmembrane component T [Tissierellia bacterium]MDD3751511.1 energy-coupling factor transporter transmembrane component T [Tissierellia bacterium]MDD4046837.1 energy-coupling factor transporter transmembrane component T [Tissierellia bacterium]MDD4679150.1 energy-coupling factor transporter transmembrane component T [Tissierellia bacterium]